VYQTKVGGFCSLICNSLFIFYCALLSYGLIFEPWAIGRYNTIFVDPHFYDPILSTSDYGGFPVLELVRGENLDRIENPLELFDIYITTADANGDIDYDSNIDMVLCSSIQNDKFEEGGIYYQRSEDLNH
jgi:hypothetical protein